MAEELADLALVRVELLEQSWSRFRPASELNRLNASAGHGPQPVSADLLRLGLSMRAAWLGTGGLFDPTVLASMRALGYDADFATVAARSASALDDVLLAAAPGMSGVTIDEPSATISLPSGVGLDPGAIGKGLAADIVAEELMSAGAHGVLVNLGGDVSLAGEPDSDEPWSIGIEDERRGCRRPRTPDADPDPGRRPRRRGDLDDPEAPLGPGPASSRARPAHGIDERERPGPGHRRRTRRLHRRVVGDRRPAAARRRRGRRGCIEQGRTAILLTEDRVVRVEKEEPNHG